MSLFSIVQGRIPPPQEQMEDPMAQPEMAAPSPAFPEMAPPMQPEMAAPAPALPGMLDGGFLGFEGGDKNNDEDNNDRRMANITRHYLNEDHSMPGFKYGGSIPGYRWGDDAPSATAPPTSDGGAYTDIEGTMAQIWAEDAANPNIDQTGANYSSNLRLRAQQYLSERDYNRGQDSARNASSGPGPDHFYEQMAFEAGEAEKERRDARQMANVTQQSEAELANQSYKKNMIDADRDRKELVGNQLSGAQDFYAKMLSQGDPNQGAQWVNPQAAYETMKNTQGPTYDAPNMPGTVFPEEWGK